MKTILIDCFRQVTKTCPDIFKNINRKYYYEDIKNENDINGFAQ